jgi:hypothetical protein
MNNLHIHILTIYNSIEEIKSSNLASLRLRQGIIAKFLLKEGFTITVGKIIPVKTNCVLVTKIGSNHLYLQRDWLDQIKIAKEKGSKIFVDYTDHHLLPSTPLTRFYLELTKLANFFITSSEHLKFLLEPFFKKRIFIITDSLEYPILEPKKQKKEYNLLWHGHSSNIKYLIEFLEEKMNERFSLVLLSNDIGLSIFKNYKFKNKNKFRVDGFLWSINKLVEASKMCDMAIIPSASDLKDQKKRGVSENRLISCLSLGLPTAADLLPSYNNLKEYFVDIRSNLFYEMLTSPQNYHGQVCKAQDVIIPKYLPENLSKEWIKIFKNYSYN